MLLSRFLSRDAAIFSSPVSARLPFVMEYPSRFLNLRIHPFTAWTTSHSPLNLLSYSLFLTLCISATSPQLPPAGGDASTLTTSSIGPSLRRGSTSSSSASTLFDGPSCHARHHGVPKSACCSGRMGIGSPLLSRESTRCCVTSSQGLR